ncbi:MAG: hypothetical protein KJ749_03445, partial [Planctomycetes bacterium]|nr:hypothetical protein [Planctomycetota bacterium]
RHLRERPPLTGTARGNRRIQYPRRLRRAAYPVLPSQTRVIGCPIILAQVEQLRGLNALGGSAKAVFRQEF